MNLESYFFKKEAPLVPFPPVRVQLWPWRIEIICEEKPDENIEAGIGYSPIITSIYSIRLTKCKKEISILSWQAP